MWTRVFSLLKSSWIAAAYRIPTGNAAGSYHIGDLDDIALSDRRYRENGQKIYTDNFGLTRQDTANSVQRDYVVDYTSAIKNDLMVYENGGFKTSYTYGANGRISQMTRPLSEEINPVTGKVISTTATAKGENINTNIAVEKLGKLYYHLDRLGSTAFITDESGMVRSYATYDEWGNVREGGSHDVNIASIDATAGFTTYTYDKVLDKYFAQYRMYDAENKRFTAEDPIKSGVNWYNYVGNRPLVFVDPMGLLDRKQLPVASQEEMQVIIDEIVANQAAYQAFLASLTPDELLMLKMTDPYQSIYLEEGLREDTVDFLQRQINAAARKHYATSTELFQEIPLNGIYDENTIESLAILGAVKKLVNAKGDAVFDDPLAIKLEYIAVEQGYTGDPWRLNSTTLGYMNTISENCQQTVDKSDMAKWSEQNIHLEEAVADLIQAIAMMGMTSNTPGLVNKLLNWRTAPKELIDDFADDVLDDVAKGAGKSIFERGKNVFDDFNLDDAYVKPKHLSTTSGKARQFLGSSKTAAEEILKDSMKNGTVTSIVDDGVSAMGNQKYKIIIDAGKTIGTRGENLVEIILSDDGGMLSAFPIP